MAFAVQENTALQTRFHRRGWKNDARLVADVGLVVVQLVVEAQGSGLILTPVV